MERKSIVSAAKIVRRHIQFTFSYSVSTLHFVNEAYGTDVLVRVTDLLHRLNRMKGLVPRFHPAYTEWVRPYRVSLQG